MTRADKITEYLDRKFNTELTHLDLSLEAQDILALATPTEYASIKDVADLTGRTKPTILSWIQRGQHDCPPALGTSSAGMIWDMDDWKRWAHDHPGLVYQDAGRTDLV